MYTDNSQEHTAPIFMVEEKLIADNRVVDVGRGISGIGALS
jgi:hypothetical protein